MLDAQHGHDDQMTQLLQRLSTLVAELGHLVGPAADRRVAVGTSPANRRVVLEVPDGETTIVLRPGTHPTPAAAAPPARPPRMTTSQRDEVAFAMQRNAARRAYA